MDRTTLPNKRDDSDDHQKQELFSTTSVKKYTNAVRFHEII